MGIQVIRSNTNGPTRDSSSGATSETGASPISFAQVMADVAVGSVGARHDDHLAGDHDHKDARADRNVDGVGATNSNDPSLPMSSELASLANLGATTDHLDTAARLDGDLKDAPSRSGQVPDGVAPITTTSLPASASIGPVSLQSVLAQLSTPPSEIQQNHHVEVLDRLHAELSGVATKYVSLSHTSSTNDPRIDREVKRTSETRQPTDITAALEHNLASQANTAVAPRTQELQIGAVAHTHSTATTEMLDASLPMSAKTTTPPGFLDNNAHLIASLSAPIAEGSGTYAMRVALHPPELGDVNAIVRVHSEGAIDVQLSTPNPAAHATLLSHLAGLRDALGANTAHIGIRLLGDESGNQGQQRDSSQSDQQNPTRRDAQQESSSSFEDDLAQVVSQ